MNDMSDSLDIIAVKSRDAHAFGNRLHVALRQRQKALGASPLVGITIYAAEYEVMNYVLVHLGREPIGVSFINSLGHFKSISQAVWSSGFVPLSGQFFRSGDCCFFLVEGDNLKNMNVDDAVNNIIDCFHSCLTLQEKTFNTN